MPFCRNCGTEITEDQKFCHKCGAECFTQNNNTAKTENSDNLADAANLLKKDISKLAGAVFSPLKNNVGNFLNDKINKLDNLLDEKNNLDTPPKQAESEKEIPQSNNEVRYDLKTSEKKTEEKKEVSDKIKKNTTNKAPTKNTKISSDKTVSETDDVEKEPKDKNEKTDNDLTQYYDIAEPQEKITFSDLPTTNKQEKKDTLISNKTLLISSIIGIIVSIALFLFAVTNMQAWPAIISIMQILLSVFGLFLYIKKLNLKIKLLPIIVAGVLLIPFFGTFKYFEINAKKIIWDNYYMSDILPEPNSTRGFVNSNNDSTLCLTLCRFSYQDFSNYIKACEENGFTIDSEKYENDFSAFNSSGYKLDLDYNSKNSAITIRLEKPIELSQIDWNSIDCSSLFPHGTITEGNILYSKENSFSAYLKLKDFDEFHEYISICKKFGFDIDATVGDEFFRASNKEGYSLSLNYQGCGIIHLSIELKTYHVELNFTYEIDKTNANDTVMVYIDDTKIGSIALDEPQSFSEYISIGSHTLSIKNTDNSIKNSITITIENNCTLEYYISCVNNTFEFNNTSKKQSEEVKAENSKAEAESSKTKETIASSSEEPTSKYNLDKDLVVAMCEKDSKYDTMYNIAFAEYDDNGDLLMIYAINNHINPRSMGDEFNAIGPLPSWFYVGATVHVQGNYSSSGGISTHDLTVTEAQKQITTNSTTSSTSTTPVISGVKLSQVVSKAKSFGLSAAYSDEDWGHNSKMRSLSDTYGGLMIDIIYKSDTQEVIGASITTNKLSTRDKQEEFAAAMAEVLSPTSYTDDVISWVNSNMGDKSTTEIGGVDYQLSVGPVDNIIFNVNMNNWEKWDSSFNN